MRASNIFCATTNSKNKTGNVALRRAWIKISGRPSENLRTLTLVGLPILLLSLLSATATFAIEQKKLFGGEGPWYEKSEDGVLKLHLYFFCSKECPHCRRPQPFLDELKQKTPWVMLHSLEITEHPENAERFDLMAGSLGKDSRATPSWLFCGGMIQGFDQVENSGTKLVELLESCHKELTTFLAPPRAMPTIPPASAPPAVFSWQTPVALAFVVAGGAWLIWRNRKR